MQPQAANHQELDPRGTFIRPTPPRPNQIAAGPQIVPGAHPTDHPSFHYSLSYPIPGSHSLSEPSGAERFRHPVANWDAHQQLTQSAQGPQVGHPIRLEQGREIKDNRELDRDPRPDQPRIPNPPQHPFGMNLHHSALNAGSAPFMGHPAMHGAQGRNPYGHSSPFHGAPAHGINIPMPGPFDHPSPFRPSPMHHTTPIHTPVMHHPTVYGMDDELRQVDKARRRDERRRRDEEDRAYRKNRDRDGRMNEEGKKRRRQRDSSESRSRDERK